MKILKKILIIVLAFVLCTGFFACKTDGIDPAKRLVMTEIEYDDVTKILSWDKVNNAVGYTVTIGAISVPAREIVENGGKMQHKIKQSSHSNDATYEVVIIAKGDKKNHFDSLAKIRTIEYSKKVQLFVTGITYDEDNWMLKWDNIEGALSYTLFMDKTPDPAEPEEDLDNPAPATTPKPDVSLYATDNQVLFLMNEKNAGLYTVTIIARGDGDDYETSDPETEIIDYSPIDWQIVRGRMVESLTEFVGKDPSAYKYSLKTDGGIIFENIFIPFGMVFGDNSPLPSFSGDAFLKNAELFLLINGGISGDSDNQYVTLFNVMQLLTMNGQMPENIIPQDEIKPGEIFYGYEDVVIQPQKTGTGSNRVDTSRGFTAEFVFNQAILGGVFTQLKNLVNEMLGNLVGMEMDSGNELVGGLTIGEVQIDQIFDPIINVEFDNDFNVTKLNLAFEMLGAGSFGAGSAGIPFGIVLRIDLAFTPSAKEVPADMEKYLSDNNYTALDFDLGL